MLIKGIQTGVYYLLFTKGESMPAKKINIRNESRHPEKIATLIWQELFNLCREKQNDLGNLTSWFLDFIRLLDWIKAGHKHFYWTPPGLAHITNIAIGFFNIPPGVNIIIEDEEIVFLTIVEE